MNSTAKCLLFVAVIMVAGCATPARMDQMTANVSGVHGASVPANLRQSFVIKDVTGGQETNPMWMSQVSSSEFERALETSLRNAGLLNENRQAGKHQVTAHLHKLEQPFIGIDMTVTATVNYTVSDRASGKTIWERPIVSPYTAKFSDSLIGVERLRIANEGAIRSNISDLIGELTRARYP